MKNKLKIILLSCGILITLVGYQNCSNSMAPLDLDSVNSSSNGQSALEIQALAVIQNKCTQCHNAQIAMGDIDYITAVSSLKYYRVVIPGEPTVSPFYTVLNQDPDHMTMLKQGEMDLLFNWIQVGMVAATPGIAPVIIPLGPTFASISRNILGPKCLSCHGSANPPRGTLDYSSYAKFTAAGVAIPGNAPASMIVIATGPNPKPGLAMPRNNPSLSPAEQKAISDWIAAGALNN